MRNTLLNIHRDGKKRATAIEYGIIAAFISIAIITVVSSDWFKKFASSNPPPAIQRPMGTR